MATQKKKSTVSLEKPSCQWCNKSFANERTLSVHMCVKKRRWADKDETHVRLGFRTFQTFYEMTTANKTPKTYEDFLHSSFYMDFVKFGRACTVNQYICLPEFVKWLIDSGIKLTKWSLDATYNTFLVDYIKKEPGLRGLERTVLYFVQWAEETGNNWQDYFKLVSPARAVHDIRSGRISPWAIYLSETGDQLLLRLSQEQINMVEHMIVAKNWITIFSNNPETVKNIQLTCQEGQF